MFERNKQVKSTNDRSLQRLMAEERKQSIRSCIEGLLY
jgi:hypothetical protein